MIFPFALSLLLLVCLSATISLSCYSYDDEGDPWAVLNDSMVKKCSAGEVCYIEDNLNHFVRRCIKEKKCPLKNGCHDYKCCCNKDKCNEDYDKMVAEMKQFQCYEGLAHLNEDPALSLPLVPCQTFCFREAVGRVEYRCTAPKSKDCKIIGSTTHRLYDNLWKGCSISYFWSPESGRSSKFFYSKMSRSVFLSLKDDDFWGNETSEEEESSRESLVEKVKETIAEETEDGEEGWQTTEKTTVPERRKTFQQGDGGFGGFERTNASACHQKSPSAVRTKTRQAAGDLPEVEAPVLGFNQTNGVRLSPSTVALNEEVKLVGGIPTTIRQDGQDLMDIFGRFGTVAIDWPCKGETNPKGYVFLIFEEEKSVGKLVSCCENELDRHFLRAPFQGRLIRVQIRPWRLADANYLVHPSIPVDSKRAVFVGGIPRPLRAVELAHMMEQYGPVLVAAT